MIGGSNRVAFRERRGRIPMVTKATGLAGLTGLRGAGLVVLLLLALSGCASIQRAEGTRDPVEPVNRAVYKFNDVLDRAILKPASEAYSKVTPDPVERGISRFFGNLGTPYVMANQLLQGKPTEALMDLWRFLLNSTVGFAGFLDVATPQGLVQHDEDLGQTLGVWGSGEGMYLVLPLFGPSTLRDVPDIPASSLASPFSYVDDLAVTLSARGVNLLSDRARLKGVIRVRDEAAVDPYIFVREAYLQRRIFLIHDGNPPIPEMEDELWDESWEGSWDEEAHDTGGEGSAPGGGTP